MVCGVHWVFFPDDWGLAGTIIHYTLLSRNIDSISQKHYFLHLLTLYIPYLFIYYIGLYIYFKSFIGPVSLSLTSDCNPYCFGKSQRQASFSCVLSCFDMFYICPFTVSCMSSLLPPQKFYMLWVRLGVSVSVEEMVIQS